MTAVAFSPPPGDPLRRKSDHSSPLLKTLWRLSPPAVRPKAFPVFHATLCPHLLLFLLTAPALARCSPVCTPRIVPPGAFTLFPPARTPFPSCLAHSYSSLLRCHLLQGVFPQHPTQRHMPPLLPCVFFPWHPSTSGMLHVYMGYCQLPLVLMKCDPMRGRT